MTACTLIRTACVALAIFAAPAWGQAPTDVAADIAATCPEAAREAAELRKQMSAPPAPATLTRPALRHNLLLMRLHDQEARAYLRSTGGPIDPATPEGARVVAVDAAHLKRLKQIVAQDGLPTAQMVGLDGVDAALTLTVHAAADPDFQERVLTLAIARVRSGEVRAEQFATLTDDVLRGQGKKQRYGTEFDWRDGKLKPYPIEDEANVDARRRELGMGTLANYTCFMQALYGAKTSP